MTKDWGIFAQGPRTLSLRLYSPGLVYASEENAQRGLDRMVERGDARRRSDGEIVTPTLGYRLSVERILR